MVNSRNNFSRTNVVAFWGDPQAYQRGVQIEQMLKDRDDKDPNQAPAPKKGDSYILAAAFIGIVLGGLAGFFIGLYTIGIEAIVMGTLAGIILGGIAGTFVGSYLKKRAARPNDFNQMNPGI